MELIALGVLIAVVVISPHAKGVTYPVFALLLGVLLAVLGLQRAPQSDDGACHPSVESPSGRKAAASKQT